MTPLSLDAVIKSISITICDSYIFTWLSLLVPLAVGGDIS